MQGTLGVALLLLFKTCKMQARLFFLNIFLIGFLAQPAVSHTESSVEYCKKTFIQIVKGPSRAEKEAYWLQEFKKALSEQNKEGQVYTLVQMALVNDRFRKETSEYGLSNLKDITYRLDLHAYARKSSNIRMKTKETTANFFGIAPLMHKTIYGAPVLPQTRWSKTVKTIAGDMAFALGGVIFSVAKYIVAPKPIHEYQVDSVRDELHKFISSHEVLSELSTSEKLQILENTTSLLSELKKPTYRSWLLGRLLIPWMITASSVAFMDQLPYDLATYNIKKMMPVNFRPYSGNSYFSDIQSQIGNFKQSKTLILYQNLWPQIDYRENPVMAVDTIKQLTKEKNVETKKIKDLSEIYQLKQIDEYDTVIILAHGSPDKISGNWPDNIPMPKMKKGANLIFLSCLLGQKGVDKSGDVFSESWVAFSDSILNEGKAFAATQLLYVNLEKADGGKIVDPEKHNAENLKFKVIQIAGSAMGFPLVTDVITNGIGYLGNDYYSVKGIRVYDSKTQQTTYVPSQNK